MTESVKMNEQEEKIVVKPPSKWKVILLNDDFTTFEFVMWCLTKVFSKNIDEAMALTNDVHEKGRGVAGIYSKEIAETKMEQVMRTALAEGYPLQLLLEKE